MSNFKYIRVVTLFTIAMSLIQCVGSNMCTDVLKRNRIQEIVIKVPCVEKYTARCGWISLNYCTFYRDTFCDKKVNETITTYYIVTDCCKGFYKAKNGTCLKKQPGVDYSYLNPTPGPNTTSTVDPGYVEAPQQQAVARKSKSEISGGGYAGIACGFVFLVIIIAFTINGVRKRRRNIQKAQKQIPPTNQVIYLSPGVASSAEPVVSCMPPPPPTTNNTRSKSASPVSRKTTPSDSPRSSEAPASVIPIMSEASRRTPELNETSEAGAKPLLSRENTLPEEEQRSDADGGVVPLLSKDQGEDDIPESDV